MLPPLPNGTQLELDSPQRLRSLDRCLVDVRATTAQTAPSDPAVGDEIVTLGPGEEALRRLREASFVVELELVKSGRSRGNDVVFLTELADAVALDGVGVVVDLAAQRMFLPGAWRVAAPLGELDPRRHVTVHVVAADDGAWIHTHGLVKFGRAELEVNGVPGVLREAVGAALLHIAAHVIRGATIKAGESVGDRDSPLRVLGGGRDREHWGETPVLELVGEDGFRRWSGA